MEERAQGRGVLGVRLVEEQDPVGRAADLLLRVAGQGLQAAADRGDGPEVRLRE